MANNPICEIQSNDIGESSRVKHPKISLMNRICNLQSNFGSYSLWSCSSCLMWTLFNSPMGVHYTQVWLCILCERRHCDTCLMWTIFNSPISRRFKSRLSRLWRFFHRHSESTEYSVLYTRQCKAKLNQLFITRHKN